MTASSPRPAGKGPERQPLLAVGSPLRDALGWPRSAPPGGYDRSFERAEAALRERWHRLETERREAATRIGPLLALSPGGRALVLRNRPRLRTWGLLECIVEAASGRCLSDPVEAEALAHLAVELADALPSDLYPATHLADLQARAWTLAARSRCVRLDRVGAAAALGSAYRLLLAGSHDPFERAHWLETKAELRCGEGRLAEAAALLRRAAAVYREAGDGGRAGHCLRSLARLHGLVGRRHEAVRASALALAELRDGDPRAAAEAWADLIAAHAAAGDAVAARRELGALGRYAAAHPRAAEPLARLRPLVRAARERIDDAR